MMSLQQIVLTCFIFAFAMFSQPSQATSKSICWNKSATPFKQFIKSDFSRQERMELNQKLWPKNDKLNARIFEAKIKTRKVKDFDEIKRTGGRRLNIDLAVFLSAAIVGDVSEVKEHLDKGFNPNQPCEVSENIVAWSYIFKRVYNKNPALNKKTLAKFTKNNKGMEIEYFGSPIMAAILGGHKDIIELMLKYNAEVFTGPKIHSNDHDNQNYINMVPFDQAGSKIKKFIYKLLEESE